MIYLINRLTGLCSASFPQPFCHSCSLFRHSRVGGNLFLSFLRGIPAFAGMTKGDAGMTKGNTGMTKENAGMTSRCKKEMQLINKINPDNPLIK